MRFRISISENLDLSSEFVYTIMLLINELIASPTIFLIPTSEILDYKIQDLKFQDFVKYIKKVHDNCTKFFARKIYAKHPRKLCDVFCSFFLLKIINAICLFDFEYNFYV